MPKTGSSAIQAFLALNECAINEKGIFYPMNYSIKNDFQVSSGNGIPLWKLFMKESKDDIVQYLNNLCSETRQTLFSSEHLFIVFKKSPDLFFEVLREFDYKIICYIRRQDLYIQSIFNQHVKNMALTSFNKFSNFNSLLGLTDALLNALNYTSAERIIVRPYEQKQFFRENIYADFLNCVGIEWDDKFKMPNKYVNPSLNREALLFRMFLNQIGVDHNLERQKKKWNKILIDYSISNAFGEPFQDHSILSNDMRRTIMEMFESKNQAIAKIFLQREDSTLFYNTIQIKDESEISLVLGEQDFIKIVSYINKVDRNMVYELFFCLSENPKQTTDIVSSEKVMSILLLFFSGSSKFKYLFRYYLTKVELYLYKKLKVISLRMVS
jgi:hypothetical protein